MTGDEEDDEIVHTGENVTNIVKGKVHGTLMQAGHITGDLVFGDGGIVIRGAED